MDSDSNRVSRLEERVEQLELLKDEQSEIDRLKKELAATKTERNSEKYRHGQTMQTLHFLQGQLAARKRHCLTAHQCCFEPPIES